MCYTILIDYLIVSCVSLVTVTVLVTRQMAAGTTSVVSVLEDLCIEEFATSPHDHGPQKADLRRLGRWGTLEKVKRTPALFRSIKYPLSVGPT